MRRRISSPFGAKVTGEFSAPSDAQTVRLQAHRKRVPTNRVDTVLRTLARRLGEAGGMNDLFAGGGWETVSAFEDRGGLEILDGVVAKRTADSRSEILRVYAGGDDGALSFLRGEKDGHGEMNITPTREGGIEVVKEVSFEGGALELSIEYGAGGVIERAIVKFIKQDEAGAERNLFEIKDFRGPVERDNILMLQKEKERRSVNVVLRVEPGGDNKNFVLSADDKEVLVLQNIPNVIGESGILQILTHEVAMAIEEATRA